MAAGIRSWVETGNFPDYMPAELRVLGRRVHQPSRAVTVTVTVTVHGPRSTGHGPRATNGRKERADDVATTVPSSMYDGALALCRIPTKLVRGPKSEPRQHRSLAAVDGGP